MLRPALAAWRRAALSAPRSPRLVLVVALLAAAACAPPAPARDAMAPPADVDTTDAATPDDAAPPADGPVPDASAPDGGDAGLSGVCASSFGSALTAAFGRIDGVVYAIQRPTDTTCAMPNSTHLIVQVLMGGAVYRMVVNVQSDRAVPDPRVRLASLPHALPPPAWAEGWHTDAPLDYADTLGAHITAGFTPYERDALVSAVAAQLHVGDRVSVYATSGDGRPESAHLVHRNLPAQDGAIVLGPDTTAPTFLLFAFDGQTF